MTLDSRRPRHLNRPTDGDDLASRRSFLVKAAVVPAVAFGAGLVPFAAFMGDAAADGPPVSPELVLTGFAVGLELALATLYDRAVATGKLGSDAKAVASSIGDHHTQHSASLGALVAAGNGPVPTAGNAGLLSTYQPRIDGATDEAALVSILGELEEAMAATYFDALGTIESTALSANVATILPVEAQHAVVWSAAADATGTPAHQPSADATSALQTDDGKLTAAAFPATAPKSAASTTTTGSAS